MNIVAWVVAAYVAIAAFVYWFILGTSSVGIRITRRDMLKTARREGFALVSIAMAWFPLAAILCIRTMQGPIVEHDRHEEDGR